jgi:hypothetical protein
MPRRPRRVREPIQVYLDRSERAQLDRLAKALGVSRAEVLRRGLQAVADAEGRSVYDAVEAMIGLDFPGAPADLAVRHDRHLEKKVSERRTPSRRRRS